MPESDQKLPERVNWFRDFLPSQFPKSKITTYEHNADWLLKTPHITAYETVGLLFAKSEAD